MSESGTLSLISELTSVTSEEDFLAKMQRVAAAIGYDHALFGIELRLPVVGTVQHITSSYPPEYQLLYQREAYINRDPTVAHCQTRRDPLLWEERIYDERSRDLMEEARAHGLGHGLSIPVHHGKIVSMLSLGRDKPFASEAEKEHVLAAGKVLASCLLVASEAVIVSEMLAQKRPKLRPREQQCFDLIVAGKNNWEMSVLLGISEDSVKFHVKNLFRKLDVSSRIQAVAKGMALGMIS